MASAFETYLDETLAGPCAQLARVTKRSATLGGRLPKAVQNGDVRAVEVALREAAGLRIEEPIAAAQEALGSFDVRGYLEGQFAADFASACQESDILLEGNFPNYTVFPFPVRVDLETTSVVINRTRTGALRPSALAAAINAERDRLERSPFNAEDFLGGLFKIWERLNAVQSAARGLDFKAPVSLKKAYQELLPFRRWRREYPETFFAFDVQRLLVSGVVDYNGYRCDLATGRSTAGALRMVDRQGQERFIGTVHFVES
jgi:hypothetical protein